MSSPSSAGPADRAGTSEYTQMSFDDLAEPLHQVSFVVVDLETTGSTPGTDSITEIGAVRVLGGEVRGEFQTMVNPGRPIPPFIRVLTGITDEMVAPAPSIDAVLPAFLEFAHGAVLVAHNARFDIGFLRAECARTERAWPNFPIVDTLPLARQLLGDEVPNAKLATLARFFRTPTTPTHRALDDARATVSVLHGLIERLGSYGVDSLDELTSFTHRVSAEQRGKRHLADAVPRSPGVYVFRDGRGAPLYIGSSQNMRSRVRSYFTAGETRSRMREMIGIAERVEPIVCVHPLEARVHELRLIAEHKPPYNRRSRAPERTTWVKLTVEPFPRLAVARGVRPDSAVYLGPFGGRRAALDAIAAVHDCVPLRQCSPRLPLVPTGSACALAGMGRCGAPCEGGESREEYARHTEVVRAALDGDPGPLVAPLRRQIEELATAQRYEEAARLRDRLAVLIRACARGQRLTALARVAHLVAASPAEDGGWDLAVVRFGRLAGAGRIPADTAATPYVDAAVAGAQTVLPGVGPLPAATVEETECVLRWLEEPGTRLVDIDGTWALPARGAGRFRSWLDSIARAALAADPFGEDAAGRVPRASRHQSATYDAGTHSAGGGRP